jgi:hypothetical protein
MANQLITVLVVPARVSTISICAVGSVTVFRITPMLQFSGTPETTWV